jgi:hypothetical protein
MAAAAIVGVLYLSPAWQQVAAYDESDNRLIPAQQLADETDGADVSGLLDQVKSLGGGRVYAGSANTWGHGYAIGSVPMYVVLLNHGMDGFGFTLRLPSLLSDSEVRFDERNPAQYDLFNLRYVVLPADSVPVVPAKVLAVRGNHRLWQVQTSGYVEVVDTIGPPIAADRYTIGRQMAGFLESPQLVQKQFPVVAYSGEPVADPTLAAGVSVQGPAGSVEAQSSRPADGIFRAEVVANRPAVVLLKTTYDPRWKVTVDGVALRPEMVAPGMVARTVTPGRHSIEFRYVPYSAYPLLLGLGLLALGCLQFGRRALDAGLAGTARLHLGLAPVRRALPHPVLALKRRPAVAHDVHRRALPMWLLSATVVFVTAWAIRSLIVTGATVLDGHVTSLLETSPPQAQGAIGDPVADTLLKIDHSIPPHASVLVFWEVPDYWGGISFGQFWPTFWLYPRKVTLTDNFTDALTPTTDVVIQVRSPDQVALTPNGYTQTFDAYYPNVTVTTYERSR